MIPHIFYVKMEVRSDRQGLGTMSSESRQIQVLGYDRADVKRRIKPVLKGLENKNHISIIIDDIVKGQPIQYLTREVIDSIYKANREIWAREEARRNFIESHPPTRRAWMTSL